MRTYKVTEDRLSIPEGRIMTTTQKWRFLNFTVNSFYILFPAKGIMTYRQIIARQFYVRLIGTCSLAGRAFLNTDE